jgi:hypothetical protein
MMEIVDELKAKLAEIDAKMEELRREIVVLGDQKSAFEKVINVYDPPATTAEIAEKFASEAHLGHEGQRFESALTSRFSATLNGLVKQGLVRQAGIVDGRRHLWEISR